MPGVSYRWGPWILALVSWRLWINRGISTAGAAAPISVIGITKDFSNCLQKQLVKVGSDAGAKGPHCSLSSFEWVFPEGMTRAKKEQSFLHWETEGLTDWAKSMDKPEPNPDFSSWSCWSSVYRFYLRICVYLPRCVFFKLQWLHCFHILALFCNSSWNISYSS